MDYIGGGAVTVAPPTRLRQGSLLDQLAVLRLFSPASTQATPITPIA